MISLSVAVRRSEEIRKNSDRHFKQPGCALYLQHPLRKLIMNLILFTASYPFNDASEQSFLEDEIQYLGKVFERIILVPRKHRGQLLPFPRGVEVDVSYAETLEHTNKIRLLAHVLHSSLFYQEIFSRILILIIPTAIIRLVRYLGGAFLTSKWANAWLINNDRDGKNTLFYTYWFDSASLGIGLLKVQYPPVRLVSRAHNYDLYEEYYKPHFWPYRWLSISYLERLFCASDAGLKYIRGKYPLSSKRYETALLGVPESGFVSSCSKDGVYRIVSCSVIIPVKRVDLLLRGIATTARIRSEQRFEWTHIGNGPLKAELEKSAEKYLPNNIKAKFLSYTDRNALMKFYREHDIDVFINVSVQEGTPVAIMEAISCGIPIIATNVGGNAEIVMEENGILLGSNPSPDEIAVSIFTLMDHPEISSSMREGSFKLWKEKYQAAVNFQAFARRLKDICDGAIAQRLEDQLL